MVWVFPFGFACLRSVAGETPWVWDVSRLLSVARDPKHLGSEIGFFTVLHTWNQKLGLHPHVHCVIPAGGLSPDHTHWVKSRERFFLPIHVLRRVFRGKFVAALRQAFRDHQLVFHGNLTLLAQPSTFAAWLRPLFRTKTGWSIRSHHAVAPSMCSSIWVATPIA